MDVLPIEVKDATEQSHISTRYLRIESSFPAHDTVFLEKGFYFLLVTNGTAAVKDIYHSYPLSANHLLILTPSVQGTLTDKSTDFKCTCLYIEPDYFDTLSAGQLVYNQVSPYIGNYQLPVFCLETEQAGYLHETMSLFARQLEKMQRYQEGAIGYLCCFLLLQIADSLYNNKKNRDTSSYVRRSSEIFRNFKRLLVHHYREQHAIQFYADRLNISTTYLSRIVKHITGHTVCFHISELLCTDARKLLECTDLDIKEIADTLGFADQSVFGKFFIRKTGLSPMKFRTQKDCLKND